LAQNRGLLKRSARNYVKCYVKVLFEVSFQLAYSVNSVQSYALSLLYLTLNGGSDLG